MRELIDQHQWDAPANRCLLQAEASEEIKGRFSAQVRTGAGKCVGKALSLILHGNAGCGSLHATLTTSYAELQSSKASFMNTFDLGRRFLANCLGSEETPVPFAIRSSLDIVSMDWSASLALNSVH